MRNDDYKWSRVAFDSKGVRSVPDSPGVYVIFCDGRPDYVGGSNGMGRRLSTHLNAMKKVLKKECVYTVRFRQYPKEGEWAMKEIRLIRKLNPPMNATHTRRGKKQVVFPTFPINCYGLTANRVHYKVAAATKGLPLSEFARQAVKESVEKTLGIKLGEESPSKPA